MSRDEVVKLAEEAARKRSVYQALAATNAHGLSPKDRVSLDAEFMIAGEEWRKAELAYRQALMQLNS